MADGAPADDGDAAGTGEEEFEAGMKQNAMERDAADADQDGRLDFDEFKDFVRRREEGEPTDEDLKKRFEALDADGSGKVDMTEYLQWSLREALARSSERVVDLFKKWDEDRSGKIDKQEFTRAIKALGFDDMEDKLIGEVFDQLDDDKSGQLEYKELNMMLRKGAGSEAVSANLKRGTATHADHGRGAKVTRKNLNENYAGARVAALPPMVKLDPSSGVSIVDQLNQILSENSVKLIDVFREWDTDGDGALDKKEFRKGIAAIGYDVPRKDADAVFSSLDDSGDGYIEYTELKLALNKHSRKGKGAPVPVVKVAKAASIDADAGDEGGTGEEEFEAGMKQNAMERDAADGDQDGKLDFGEFCAFIRNREEGEPTDEDLKKRFEALDGDGSGKVDMTEYLQWSLREALARSSERVVDLFKKWDEDRSGKIDKNEFTRAIKALGFDDMADSLIGEVFDQLDDDKSGQLEYKELNMMLRKGVGSEAVAANLKRGTATHADHGRGAALTRKNLNQNYAGARVAALPPMVKLDPSSGVSIVDQLNNILSEHSVKLIDLFREWDNDGDGALDKKEFRKGIAAIGYDVPRKDADAVFKSLDDSGDGYIEYTELKQALNKHSRKGKNAPAPAKASKAADGAADGDEGGTGEEEFEVGMKQNAMERDAADADQDGKLDFGEFCALVRQREEGDFTDEDLKKRFEALDADGSGKVDMAEYLCWSLRDALTRSSERVCDLFKKWDEDNSGKIDKREFTRAVRSMGFPDISDGVAGVVFDTLDDDKSGQLEYKELNTMLRKGAGSEAVKANLKRAKSGRDASRGAALTAKNLNENYVGNKIAALPPMVQLDAKSGVTVPDQLNAIMLENSVKLIDLFREWDTDGNGAIDKKEFRQAIAALGYDAKKSEMNKAFDMLDDTGDGFIEYGELKAALSKHSKKGKGKLNAKPEKAKPAASAAAEDGDVAGEGDEDFEVGMKQNAMERDAADGDQDGKLDFKEFCALVRNREEGDFTDADLKKRFDALDEDGSGKVDMTEYLQWSLRDSLARSSERVVDLFSKWDEDKSGKIDKREFTRAIKALGFDDMDDKMIGDVFDTLDDDKSGQLEYKELNMMLRKGAGSEAVKNNLKRATSRRDDSRGAALTAKNLNENYVGNRIAALPPMVKLDPKAGTIPDQLNAILQEHSVKLIDLFRDWDSDGNGAIDKKEFRQAIAALGYDVKKSEANKAFDMLDDTGDGFIEYGELKAALNKHSKKGKGKLDAKKASKAKPVDPDADEAGTGEEDFEVGMKQNAMERDAADGDQDGKLDFKEFCALVRDREEGDFTTADLKKRFDALDADGSGKVDMAEYLQWSLRDSLARSSERVVDLFKKWDEDNSGKIDKREFTRAIKSLGFDDMEDALIHSVFDQLDDDKSGQLEYKELNMMLRKGVGSEAAKNNLKRATSRRDDSRGAALTAKNLNVNYQGNRIAALPPMVKLDTSGVVSVADQLAVALAENDVKLIDLFRDWDDNGDGAVDKKEFRKAVAALGYDVPKAELDAAFDSLDESGDGAIEYNELKKALAAKFKEADAACRVLREQKKKEEKARLRAERKEAKAKAEPPKVALPPFPEIPAEEDGGEVVIQPSGHHTHTVILLHSIKGAPEMFSRLYLRFGILNSGFKFVFPRAPNRTMAVPRMDGATTTIPGWFTPTRSADGTIDPTEVGNLAELQIQTTRLHGILEREAAYLGNDTSRLVLGGIHQGGAVAIHAAMTYPKPLAALLCLRTVPLGPAFTQVPAEKSGTKVFVFAGDRDVVHPIERARLAYEPLASAGLRVEWHVECELTHSADCLNEQRWVAYWVAKTCLGDEQGDMLKQAIVIVKRPKPRAISRPKKRAQSARARMTSPREGPAETGFIHSLYREPEWRRIPLKGPAWDTTTAPGFASPFAPLFSSPAALSMRIDRGGPMLGRVIRRQAPLADVTVPDLLGDARTELHADAAAAAPGGIPPHGSHVPSRIHSARERARPAWNDDTSPRPGVAADIRPGSAFGNFGGMGAPSAPASRPHSGNVTPRVGSARPVPPRNARPMSAAVPQRAPVAEFDGTGGAHGMAAPRPMTGGATRPNADLGPRGRKLKQNAAM